MSNEELADYIVVYKDEAGEYRWRAKSNNGNTVAGSEEGYENRLHAENMASGLFPKLEIRHEESD